MAFGDFPTKWDAPKSVGLLWKAHLPLTGRSSPVVWGDRVFITAADQGHRQVLCFDANSGKQLWTQTVNEAGGDASGDVSADATYAAPTPATDGQCVVALFASGDLACIDFAGKTLWEISLGTPQTQYALASSLLLVDGKVIVQFDQGQSEQEGKSSLLAFDLKTGKKAWETKRTSGSSWGTPILAQTPDGPQIITSGSPYVFGYNPKSGVELWRAKCLDGEIVASPAFTVIQGKGLAIFIANNGVHALHTDGKGDVTGKAEAWANDDFSADIVSPVARGDRVWLLDNGGTVHCLNAATGKGVWEHDTNGAVQASPVLIDKNLYVLDTSGVMHILNAGDVDREVATCPIDQDVTASPAFANGRIYIRGATDLFCVGQKK